MRWYRHISLCGRTVDSAVPTIQNRRSILTRAGAGVSYLVPRFSREPCQDDSSPVTAERALRRFACSPQNGIGRDPAGKVCRLGGTAESGGRGAGDGFRAPPAARLGPPSSTPLAPHREGRPAVDHGLPSLPPRKRRMAASALDVGCGSRGILAHLAVEREVAAATQDQALDAIVLLCNQVLEIVPGPFARCGPGPRDGFRRCSAVARPLWSSTRIRRRSTALPNSCTAGDCVSARPARCV